MRTLLRETAQPVAVVTALMPPSGTPTPSSSDHQRFHGATLSSFSSVSMDPHPLVAFSLRVPSRLATSLKEAHAATHLPSHMVVNILSAAQAALAVHFSQPDLYPNPFSATRFTLTAEGLPVLAGALGALSCKLIAGSWPLHDLESLESRGGKEAPVWDGEGVASELFIARVTRVESVVPLEEEDGLRTSPLIYYRRSYATTRTLYPGDDNKT
ncbi:uncharacterized protein LAESUDRAFT_756048 [Laetiporus sulphureus 93-53]|uniref:Flavin reductase like domain-containing protein n=1 Tax=Laetiporus sulphureus 93-53 TaxID=1314785 RepID=A0A165G4F9_9APHY|nr:uncharacterized protein LAESUDRAFT_756048 [Laetiporus sulphureus 93-53]KZT09816.1 hypothetical protein LAESUDRAFT_756048 [Laetiporus sulphureus 93-53]